MKFIKIKIPKFISVILIKDKDNEDILILKKLNKITYLKVNVNIFLIKKKRMLIIVKQSLKQLSKVKYKKMLSMCGTTKALIKTKIKELTYNSYKTLKIIGVGYKAEIINFKHYTVLQFKLGYSHLIYFKLPENIYVKIIKFRKIFIYGKSNQLVSQIAAYIRDYRSPDCYKGKGVLYFNENIKLKIGKKV